MFGYLEWRHIFSLAIGWIRRCLSKNFWLFKCCPYPDKSSIVSSWSWLSLLGRLSFHYLWLHLLGQFNSLLLLSFLATEKWVNIQKVLTQSQLSVVRLMIIRPFDFKELIYINECNKFIESLILSHCQETLKFFNFLINRVAFISGLFINKISSFLFNHIGWATVGRLALVGHVASTAFVSSKVHLILLRDRPDGSARLFILQLCLNWLFVSQLTAVFFRSCAWVGARLVRSIGRSHLVLVTIPQGSTATISALGCS